MKFLSFVLAYLLFAQNIFADITLSGVTCTGVTIGYNQVDIVLTGDSISKLSGVLTQYETHYTGLFTRNTGVNGDTWDKVDTRFATDVVAHAPKVCFIHCGINDLRTDNKTFAQQQTYIDSIKSKCDAANIKLCIAEVLPVDNDGEHDTAIANWNTALASWCTANSVTLLRCHDAMEDPNNDNRPSPVYYTTPDLLHPNTTGQTKLGDLYYASYKYNRNNP